MPPSRLLDTRTNLGGAGPVAAKGTVHLQVTGRGGIPTTGVSAVVLNVTVTSPTAPGFITAYPDGATRPTSSNLNFTAGQSIPNLVVAKLSTDGKVALYNGSPGTTQLIADVAGYYLAGSVTSPGGFQALDPARLLDTRTNLGGAGPVAAKGTVHLQVTGRGGIPTTGVSAVVLNVTVTSPTAPGFITAYPDGATRPTSSNLNFTAGQSIPNLVVAKLSTDGKVALYNGSSGTTQLIADVAGYYLGASAAAPQPAPAVTGITPSHGPSAGGTMVIVSGTDLTNASQVLFGNVPGINITVSAAGQLSVSSPPGTGTVDVRVTTPAGTSAPVAAARFTYDTPTWCQGAYSPEVHVSGSLAASTTWGTDCAGQYVVDSTVTVPTGVLLTVLPGTVVKFSPSTGLVVNGTLNAAGTATNPVILTSVWDTTTGADTTTIVSNPSTPQPGDWKGINAPNSSGATITVAHTTIAYASTGVAMPNGGSLSLTASTITKTDGGVYASALTNPVITGNTFTAITNLEINLTYSGITLAKLDGNTATNSTGAPVIELSSCALTTSGTFPWTSTNLNPVIWGGLTIPTGTTLTLNPGTILKLYGSSGLVVNGTLNAAGTATNPVILTSVWDTTTGADTTTIVSNPSTPQPGDWKGIKLSAVKGAVFDHLVIRYADTAIQVGQLTDLTVDNSQFAYNTRAFSVGNAVGDDPVTQSLVTAIQSSDKVGVSACLPPYTSFVHGSGNWYGRNGFPGVGGDWTQYLGLAAGDASTLYSWVTPFYDTNFDLGTNTIPWTLYSCPPLAIPPFPVTPILTNVESAGGTTAYVRPMSPPFPALVEQ
ncbi:IPT/TIG domain-containing protein [Phycicoccus sp. M110.8]|uniref:IPT/TIG domain-containing protein n=1 Tax=Phycicoccus sp. M110.8 TaxID=3075433 RepID=UPI0028FDA40B|nr:IPT/TIG domain-containing protein [Phycicoccus sp. M110.8]MDU0314735.1 IPT/TIG domain-containing protein [Phycicoccus sp. M110.8]